MHKFAQALEADAEMPSTGAVLIDITTDPGKLQDAAKRRNEIAMVNYTMAFVSERTISMVYDTVTVEWPDGLAYHITNALKKKYMPQDNVTCVELRHMLNKASMKPNSDPRVILSKSVHHQEQVLHFNPKNR